MYTYQLLYVNIYMKRERELKSVRKRKRCIQIHSIFPHMIFPSVYKQREKDLYFYQITMVVKSNARIYFSFSTSPRFLHKIFFNSIVLFCTSYHPPTLYAIKTRNSLTALFTLRITVKLDFVFIELCGMHIPPFRILKNFMTFSGRSLVFHFFQIHYT